MTVKYAKFEKKNLEVYISYDKWNISLWPSLLSNVSLIINKYFLFCYMLNAYTITFISSSVDRHRKPLQNYTVCCLNKTLQYFINNISISMILLHKF